MSAVPGSGRVWEAGVVPEQTTRHRLLVSVPDLGDVNFDQTVVYVIEHDGDGALGVVLNRPSDTEVVEHLPELCAPVLSPAVFFVGGPVAVGGVLALGRRRLGSGSEPTGPVAPLPGSLALVDMEALLDGRVDGIDALRLFTGYSGWAAGQLDAEIAAGAWHVVTALPDDVLCGDPDSLWRSVMRRQGGRTAAQGLFPEDPSVN